MRFSCPNTRGILAAAAALLALPALPVGAATETMDDDETPISSQAAITGAHVFGKTRTLSAFTALAENDVPWGDKYYSNGVKFTYTTPEVFADGLPRFLRDAVMMTPLAEPSSTQSTSYRFHFSLAQEIHTPKYEHQHFPPPGDHPYAGLLYGTVALSSETASRLDSLELSLGVIGPSSLANQTQNNWHHFIGSPIVSGWHTQLHDEPLVQFAWTRVGKYNWLSSETFSLEWMPRVRLELGTVRDYAALGCQWRAGWNVPSDFGTPHLRTSPAFTRPTRNSDALSVNSWRPDAGWFYADIQAEIWAWNMTLDGNAWHKSAHIHSYPWVGQVAVGFALQWGRWQLSISEVVRSKEFRRQDSEVTIYTLGSISVTF